LVDKKRESPIILILVIILFLTKNGVSEE